MTIDLTVMNLALGGIRLLTADAWNLYEAVSGFGRWRLSFFFVFFFGTFSPKLDIRSPYVDGKMALNIYVESQPAYLINCDGYAMLYLLPFIL